MLLEKYATAKDRLARAATALKTSSGQVKAEKQLAENVAKNKAIGHAVLGGSGALIGGHLLSKKKEN